MVTVLLSWLYIAFLCTLIGIGVLGVFKNIQFSWIYYLAAGIVVITVYTEYFSLFAKIGAMAHILLFFSALVCGYVRRAKLRILWKTYAPVFCSSGGGIFRLLHSIDRLFYFQGRVSYGYEHLSCGGDSSI